jgi:hypothetical protein
LSTINRAGGLGVPSRVVAVLRADVAGEFPYSMAGFQLKCAMPLVLTRT